MPDRMSLKNLTSAPSPFIRLFTTLYPAGRDTLPIALEITNVLAARSSFAAIWCGLDTMSCKVAVQYFSVARGGGHSDDENGIC